MDIQNNTQYLLEALESVSEWKQQDDDYQPFHWFKFLCKAREHGLGYDLFFDLSVVKNIDENEEPILRVIFHCFSE